MSQLNVNSIVDAAGGSSAVLYGVASPPNSMGFRNRLINSDMRIDQRNAGASVTQAVQVDFPVDRWFIYGTVTTKFTAQRNAGSVAPPAGFTNYLGITSSSSYSVLTGDTFGVVQRIEGFNTADLAWGTASAQTITLSFWVRSSLTGTFGGAIQNSTQDRNYPFTYVISAANTWEQKTVVIPGDTTGTWLTTNGVGLGLYFGMGAGATYSGTAGAWASGNKWTATGATSVVGTNGATFYITGVQLEAGSVASPFERRDYGRELMMCCRYYWKWVPTDTGVIVTGQAYSTGGVIAGNVSTPVQMRATPTVTQSAAGDFRAYTAMGTGPNAFTTSGWRSSSPNSIWMDSQGSSGLTAGNATGVYHTLAAWIAASSEL